MQLLFSFNKYLSRAYYNVGTVVGTGISHEQDIESLCPRENYIQTRTNKAQVNSQVNFREKVVLLRK